MVAVFGRSKCKNSAPNRPTGFDVLSELHSRINVNTLPTLLRLLTQDNELTSPRRADQQQDALID